MGAGRCSVIPGVTDMQTEAFSRFPGFPGLGHVGAVPRRESAQMLPCSKLFSNLRRRALAVSRPGSQIDPVPRAQRSGLRDPMPKIQARPAAGACRAPARPPGPLVVRLARAPFAPAAGLRAAAVRRSQHLNLGRPPLRSAWGCAPVPRRRPRRRFVVSSGVRRPARSP